MRRRSCSAAWLAVLALGWAACEEQSHPIRVESIDLAEGDYYELRWGGTQEERFYAVARRDGAMGEYAIVSPERNEPCMLGADIEEVRTVAPTLPGKYVVGSPAPALVELYSEAGPDRWRTLSFAGLDCVRSDLTLDLPGDYPFQIGTRLFQADLMEMKYLHIARDGGAEYADPRTGERTRFEHVTNIWGRETNAWLAEDGSWVKRDFDGKEVARHGTNVSSLTLLGDSGDVAYTKRNPEGDSRKGGDLILVRGGREKKIAELACFPTPIDSVLPGALAFLAPCETGRLTIARADGKQYTYETGVSNRFLTMQGRLLFRIDRDDKTELWLVRSSDIEHATKQVEFPRWVEDPSVWPGRGGVIFLITHELDANYKFWRITLTGNTIEFVPAGDPEIQNAVGFAWADQGSARLTSDGTLYLTDWTHTRISKTIATNVNVDFEMVFGNNQPAVAYRTDVDPDTNLGHLQLQFLNGDYFDIDEGVREFIQVWWPERGLLYATGGATPKLRFARTIIPCQAASSAPWACDF